MSRYIENFKFAVLLLCWYFCTLCSSMSGKAFVKDTFDAMLPSTISLGCAALVFSVTYLIRQGPTPAPSLYASTYSHWTFSLGFVQFLAATITYTSFALSSVSWTYCFRTLEPLISAGLQFLVFGDTISKKEVLSLIVLAGGIAFTVNSSAKSQTYSLWIGGLALTATAIYSARSVMAKHIMKDSGISSKDLFLHSSFYGFLFSLMAHLARINFGSFSSELSWSQIKQLCVAGGLHCVYNLFSFVILQDLHPIAHGVCNSMKRVFIVVISSVISGQWLNLKQLIGISVANMATVTYNNESKKRSTKNTRHPSLLQDANEGKSEESTLVSVMGNSENDQAKRRLGYLVGGISLFGIFYLGYAMSVLTQWKLRAISSL